MSDSKKITVLSGGVGGSKLVDGVAKVRGQKNLSVIANTGDDVEIHGLWISPDIDTVTYTLAGLEEKSQGWGRADETFRALETLAKLGEETWFRLGDRDLGLHILRTRLLKEKMSLTEITARIATAFGIEAKIIPATNDRIETRVLTEKGLLNFQEYFVRERCAPEIREVQLAGAESAVAAPPALTAIASSDVIIIAPSNPIASIGPILAPAGMKHALATTKARRVAVSPIVGGKSLKGPSDRMLIAAGLPSSSIGVADYYKDLIDLLVIDNSDASSREEIESRGIGVLVTDTVMNSLEKRERLAGVILTHLHI